MQFTDSKVRLHLLDNTPSGRVHYTDISRTVTVTFVADPVLASWGIERWDVRLSGHTTFTITTVGPDDEDMAPSVVSIPLNEVPVRFSDTLDGLVLSLRSLHLSFDQNGVFCASASYAQF
jgi:hypothetical protein